MAKHEFKVININKNGEVFDPSTVTIHAGQIVGFDNALRELVKTIQQGGNKA